MRLVAYMLNRLKIYSSRSAHLSALWVWARHHISGRHLHNSGSCAARSTRDRALLISRQLPGSRQRLIEIRQEPSSSAWLSTLPLEEHGPALRKFAFHHAVHLRYGSQLLTLPAPCVCGSAFNVTHALQCCTGGLPSVRRNAVCDFLADTMTIVCHDVSVKPVLQPLSASMFTTSCARLDIVTSGFYGGQFERALFDVRVFNPLASSIANRSSLASCCRCQEVEKRLRYSTGVRNAEHASFVPVVMSCDGGLASAACATLKHLAALVAV